MKFSLRNILRATTIFFASALLSCDTDNAARGDDSPPTNTADSSAAYYVDVRLYQSHKTADPTVYFKDKNNAMDIKLPVARSRFNTIDRGTNLVDDFRSASFWTEGSWGNTHLKVKNKPVVKSAADTSSYDVTLELKQSHFSLDLGKHIKDKFNAVKFKWQVPGDVYKNMHVGDDLIKDGFRSGSFWFKGSIGDWHLKVKSLDGPSK